MWFKKLLIKLRCKKIGMDVYGNTYYESRFKNVYGYCKRYVIFYKGEDASQVSPEWFGWLHYNSNTSAAVDSSKKFILPHTGNLTHTILSKKFEKQYKRDYSSWRPN